MKINKFVVVLVAALMAAGSLVASAQQKGATLDQVKAELSKSGNNLNGAIAAMADRGVSLTMILAALAEVAGKDAVLSAIPVLIQKGANPAAVTTSSIPKSRHPKDHLRRSYLSEPSRSY